MEVSAQGAEVRTGGAADVLCWRRQPDGTLVVDPFRPADLVRQGVPLGGVTLTETPPGPRAFTSATRVGVVVATLLLGAGPMVLLPLTVVLMADGALPITWADPAGVALLVLLTGWLCVAAGFILANPQGPVTRYYGRRLRRILAGRADAWVRPADGAVHAVEWTPRANWTQVKADTAVDHGFIRVDPQERLLLYEGDHFRLAVDGDAIHRVGVERLGGVAAGLAFATVIHAGDVDDSGYPVEFCFLHDQTLGVLTTRVSRRRAQRLCDAIAAITPEQAVATMRP